MPLAAPKALSCLGQEVKWHEYTGMRLLHVCKTYTHTPGLTQARHQSSLWSHLSWWWPHTSSIPGKSQLRAAEKVTLSALRDTLLGTSHAPSHLPRSFNQLWANSKSEVLPSRIPKDWHLPPGNSTTGNYPQPRTVALAISRLTVLETLWSEATSLENYALSCWDLSRGTEALEGLLECQSNDYGNSSYRHRECQPTWESLKSYHNPYFHWAQKGRSTKHHQGCKRHTVSSAKKNKPQRSMGLHLPAASS